MPVPSRFGVVSSVSSLLAVAAMVLVLSAGRAATPIELSQLRTFGIEAKDGSTKEEITVLAVVPFSNAQRFGFRAEDIIKNYQVGGESGKDLFDLKKVIDGAKDDVTNIKFEIVRKNVTSMAIFTLTVEINASLDPKGKYPSGGDKADSFGIQAYTLSVTQGMFIKNIVPTSDAAKSWFRPLDLVHSAFVATDSGSDPKLPGDALLEATNVSKGDSKKKVGYTIERKLEGVKDKTLKLDISVSAKF